MNYISYGIESFNTTPKGSNSGNFSLGIRFQVAEERKVVGFRIFTASLTGSVTVKLWDSNKQLIASATGQRIQGTWAEFHLDTPVMLAPNAEYRLAYYTNSSYQWFDLNSITTFDGFTFLGACEVSGNAYPANNSSSFWGVDVVFDDTPPYSYKYLIQSEDSLFTTTAGVLTKIEGSVNAELFRTYGSDDIPSSELLVALIDPTVLCWVDSTDVEIQPPFAVVNGIPFSQTLESSDYFISDEAVLGIEKAVAVATETVQFAVSFDSGVTWKTFIGGTWAELSESSSGMSATTLNAIPTESWNAMTTNGKFRFRISLMDETSEFTSLIVDYLNEAEAPANSSEGDE